MFTFMIRPDAGEPYEVKAGTRDIVVWEQTGRDRSMSGLMATMRMTDVYEIAHIAARRQQMFNGALKEFNATVDLDITSMDRAGPDPTQQAP